MKRILALAIAIVMVMALVPSLAFAEGEITTQEDLIAALADVNVSTITLGADITLDSDTTLTINRDLTLDLGGRTLASSPVNNTVSGYSFARTIMQISGGTVTVQNGTIRGGETTNCSSTSTKYTVDIKAAASVVFNNVDVYGSKAINSRVGATAIQTYGSLTLNSCEIYSGDSIKDAAEYVSGVSCGSQANSGCALYADGCNVTITDSIIKGGDGITQGVNDAYPTWNSKYFGSGANLAVGSQAIRFRGNRKLTITGSTIVGGNSNAYNAGDAINETATAEISNSTILGGNAFGVFTTGGYGIGGRAIVPTGSCTTLTLTNCVIKGGDVGDSAFGLGYGIDFGSMGKPQAIISKCFIGGGDVSEGCSGKGNGSAIRMNYSAADMIACFATPISDSVLYANEKAYNNGALIQYADNAEAAVPVILGANNPTTLACVIGKPLTEHIKMVPALWADYIDEIIADVETIDDTVDTLAEMNDTVQMDLLSEGDALDKLEEAYKGTDEVPDTVVLGTAAQELEVNVVGAALSVEKIPETPVTPHLFVETVAEPLIVIPEDVTLAEGTKLVPLSIKLYDSAEKTNEIPLKLPVKITMKIPQGFNNAKKIGILHFDDAGNYKGIIYPTVNAAANTMTFITPSFSTFTVVNVDESRTDESLVKMGVDPSYVVVIPSTVEFGTLSYDESAIANTTGFYVTVQQAFIAKTATITVTAASDYAMENGEERIEYLLFKNALSATEYDETAVLVDGTNNVFATFGYGEGVTQINTDSFDATVWGYLSCARNQIKYAGSYSDVMTFTITYNP